jgi:hypothetical protein
VIIEFQFWHLISLLFSFFGCVAGFVKLIYAQNEKRREADLSRFEAEILSTRAETRDTERSIAPVVTRLDALENTFAALNSRMESAP